MVNTSVEKGGFTAKTTAETLSKTATTALADFGSLAKAYQDLALRNVETLSASFLGLTSVKTPIEFFETQGKMFTDGFATAFEDCRTIGTLTVSLITAACEPIQHQVSTVQENLKTAA